MEPSMSADIGLIEDKQFIASCHGFVTANDSARNLCGKFVKNGFDFYDVISRYDDLCSYVLVREGGKKSSAIKMILPFLRAFNVSDLDALRFAREDIKLLDGAKDSLKYIYETLPSFISTSSMEHHVMAVSESTGFPIMNIGCAHSSLDDLDINKKEMRSLREIAGDISSLKTRKSKEIPIDAKTLDADDTEIVNVLDEIFLDVLPKMEFHKEYNKLESVGVNEKAYALLEIRKKTEVDLTSTIYVGGDASDYQALDLVRDSSGLAISFNGREHAVHGCNVAVMSKDTTVVSALTSVFYDGGIESIFNLLENWTPAKLKKYSVPEDHPISTLVKKYPKKLPVVKKVDRHNVDEVARESEKFRQKLVC